MFLLFLSFIWQSTSMNIDLIDSKKNLIVKNILEEDIKTEEKSNLGEWLSSLSLYMENFSVSLATMTDVHLSDIKIGTISATPIKEENRNGLEVDVTVESVFIDIGDLTASLGIIKFPIGPITMDVSGLTIKLLIQIATNNIGLIESVSIPVDDMQITVPGTKGLVKIASFESTLKILEKSFYPRLLTIIGDDGINHHFLLKGTDIRIDYRIMQFLLLLNSFLSKNRITSSLSVTQYSIIPLTKSAGLISWVDNSDSLEYIIKKFSENRIKEKEIIKSSFKPCTRQMNSFQLYEIFDTIAKQTEADELDQYIWLTASTSSLWLKNNNNFACSSALMSIAGYIIGLGNRCPGNILMHSVNGKISEYDFQDSFEVLMHRVNHPEKVPFRLTRMISNALDGSNPYGLFKRTCEDVLSVLKLSKQTVIAQFELFTMDSTISKNSKFSNAKIVERIKEKLEGKDIFVLRKETKTVEEQVQALIQVASNPELYATQSYVWRSYW